MASAIRKLTGVGGDVRKIARLLQKKAPPGHMLAYINQEEADLLKSRGGSGKPHADTGVPSFEDEYTEFDSPMNISKFSDALSQIQIEPRSVGALDLTKPDYSGQYGFRGNFPTSNVDVSSPAQPAVQAQPNIGQYSYGAQSLGDAAPSVASAPAGAPIRETPADLSSAVVGPSDAQRQAAEAADYSRYQPQYKEIDKDLLGQFGDYLKNLKPDTKARLGIGGIESILAAYQISQGVDQAKKYREDLANVAKPYQEQGKRLVSQAQRGELTPVAQQQLQAAQAQAAQGAQARGGVGAQQAMMAVETMRQQLLQNQYDYGLKISGIGDNIATGAIKAGMQADQYVNSLAASYANNISRLLAGSPTTPAKE
jgi:hypothetical protein